MEFRVLGPLEVVDEGRSLQLGSVKQRTLLAALLVNAGRVVSSDRLIDILWGESPPADPAGALQTYVSRLRRVVDPDQDRASGSALLASKPPGYVLRLDSQQLDAADFEAQVVDARARSGDDPAGALSLLADALGLWRGPALAEFADTDFARAEATRLESLRQAALEERGALRLAVGQHNELIAETEALVGLHPLQEPFRAQLMVALYRAGRQVDALRVFQDYRSRVAEMGLEPSGELQALETSIVRRDPELAWPDRVSSPGAREATSVAAARLPEGVLTFLLTDIEGSTALWDAAPSAMAEALARHERIIAEAVADHGGIVVKSKGEGDSTLSVFPQATAAVNAAVALQRLLIAEEWNDELDLKTRVVLHTGEAQLRDDDYFGGTLNRAARIRALAAGGQILCSRATADLIAESLPEDVSVVELGTQQLQGLRRSETIYALVHPDLPAAGPTLQGVESLSNLPYEVSEFIGREDDVQEVIDALSRARIVSIVGPGGVGKTRLGIRAAREIVSDRAGGAWLCELASLRTDDSIAEAVANTLRYAPPSGMSVPDGLRQFLQHKHMLILLDNCEHVIDAVAQLVENVTTSAPDVSFVITSREPLHVPGEQVYALPTMDLPPSDDPVLVENSEAGALFLARARAAGCDVTDIDSGVVRSICEQLEGIPLALELAAARAASMSLSEIAERLDERLALLTVGSRTSPERHRTLRATVEWSAALLDAEQIRVFAELSVFVGGSDLGSAASVSRLEDERHFTDLLSSLVSKSLVERSDLNGSSRYRMLETIREYAAELLGDELHELRDRHAEHYLGRAMDVLRQLPTAAEQQAWDWLEREIGNIGAAGRWLLDTRRPRAILAMFDRTSMVDAFSLPISVAAVLDALAAEAIEQIGPERPPGFAETCAFASISSFGVGDLDRQEHYANLVDLDLTEMPIMIMVNRAGLGAMRADNDARDTWLRAAIGEARRRGDDVGLAYALGFLATVGSVDSSLEQAEAEALADEAIVTGRRTGASASLGWPLIAASIVYQQSDPDRAFAAAEEGVRNDRSQRRFWAQTCWSTAGLACFRLGLIERGLTVFRDVLTHFERTGDLGQITLQLGMLADAIAPLDPPAALRLASITESEALAAVAVFDWEGQIKLAIEQMPSEAVATARAHGRVLSYDEAIHEIYEIIDALIEKAARTSASL